MSLFLLFLWKIFHQLDLELYRQKLLAGTKKENSQIFNEDFYLPLYLPLCRAGLAEEGSSETPTTALKIGRLVPRDEYFF
jgi:hypothetical protein